MGPLHLQNTSCVNVDPPLCVLGACPSWPHHHANNPRPATFRYRSALPVLVTSSGFTVLYERGPLRADTASRREVSEVATDGGHGWCRAGAAGRARHRP